MLHLFMDRKKVINEMFFEFLNFISEHNTPPSMAEMKRKSLGEEKRYHGL